MFFLLSTALASPTPSLQAVLESEAGLSEIPKGLRIVAVSNLAGGCARDQDLGCLEATVERALELAPYDQPVDEIETFATHGLYAAHLSIVLGEAVGAGLTTHQPLQEAVAEDLIAATRADPLHNPPSYAGDPSQWPADQAAALYGIHLYDPSAADELFAAWKAVLDDRGTDKATGLPVSELTGRHGYSTTPRGCALFWTVAYLAEVDRPYADQLMTTASRALATQTLLGLAMREYPPGRDQPWDWDSGPIIMGVGTAASAFAIGAAYAVDRTELRASLRTSEARVQQMIDSLPASKLGAASHGAMADSIRYRWYR